MRVVILDDLSDTTLTHHQEVGLARWFNHLGKLFPHGEVQIFHADGDVAAKVLKLLLEQR